MDDGPREAADEREGEPPAPPPRGQPPPALRGEVVEMRGVAGGPREWNLWELERLARASAQRHPERMQEWAYLFVHLRQYARTDGTLPREFDGLVRESFGELLERAGRA